MSAALGSSDGGGGAGGGTCASILLSSLALEETCFKVFFIDYFKSHSMVPY